jgi:hypothetical protein
VQIDTLRWNADGRSEIILGFVYQLKRGDWWFGTRKAANMTPPAIKKLRRWLGLVVAKPEALRVLPIEWPDSSIAQYAQKQLATHAAKSTLVDIELRRVAKERAASGAAHVVLDTVGAGAAGIRRRAGAPR